MTRIGWCPGGRTVADMLARYPLTSAVRIFFGPGDGLPASAWTDPRQALAQVPAGADVIASHKDQGVDAAAFVTAWEATGRTGQLILVPHHEPEQQEGGDPPPAQFRASWTRTREQVGDHPARRDGRLQLAVCYTLQWIRGGGNWRTWWPEHEADAVDLVLFDWYQYEPGAPNPFRPRSYEDPASAIAPMTAIAAAVGKDWGIAEIDHLRITRENGFAVDLDPTGEMCAAWYRRMFAAAKAAGCQLWCHFHRGHGDLTSRLPEQLALRELIGQEAADVGAQRRLDWIRRGSPFRLMTPATDLRDRLRGYGYTVYDIGNRSHLEHDPPEDHTPYSATGYPGAADYGVGYAIDIMSPPAGSGLPSLQQLGAQLLADRKAGAGGIRWLKYMNWEPERDNGGDCWHESWQPAYARWSSSDRGHIHLSGLTGYETSTIAAGYDPVARIRGEDDMALFEQKHADAIEYMDGRVEALAYGRTTVRTGLRGAGNPVWAVQAIKALTDAVGKLDDQVAAQLADDLAKIEAAVAATGESDKQRDQAAAAQLTTLAEQLGQLAELVRAGQSGYLAADEVLRRMGEVLTAGTSAQG
ncbi:hypothetical protein [Micromonospora sp. RTP1Z1]|uniref:hypothetical protein n=1 Tax=Micromonospora sp. RTP1Z1 TaxID=2994043 RepID=UPI0029C98386|nr:hypothetical protein [Micromonospora sp. RTP1Z1]